MRIHTSAERSRSEQTPKSNTDQKAVTEPSQQREQTSKDHPPPQQPQQPQHQQQQQQQQQQHQQKQQSNQPHETSRQPQQPNQQQQQLNNNQQANNENVKQQPYHQRKDFPSRSGKDQQDQQHRGNPRGPNEGGRDSKQFSRSEGHSKDARGWERAANGVQQRTPTGIAMRPTANNDASQQQPQPPQQPPQPQPQSQQSQQSQPSQQPQQQQSSQKKFDGEPNKGPPWGERGILQRAPGGWANGDGTHQQRSDKPERVPIIQQRPANATPNTAEKKSADKDKAIDKNEKNGTGNNNLNNQNHNQGHNPKATANNNPRVNHQRTQSERGDFRGGGGQSQEDNDRDRRHRRRRGKDRDDKDLKYTIAPRILTKKTTETTTTTSTTTTPNDIEVKTLPNQSPPIPNRDISSSPTPSSNKVPLSRIASPTKADSSSSTHSHDIDTPPTFQILRPAEVDPRASPALPAKNVNAPVKLLTKRLKLCSEPLESLLKDQYDFTVIGVLGGEGVGKSTILSSLCRHCSGGPDHPDVFPVQTEDTILNCCHETDGIDAFVTPERVILLDSQPLQSPSVLATMIREDVPLPASLSLQNHFELQNLQLVLFLLSVCHVVIVASDWVSQNIRLWKLIRTALMLKRTLTTPPMLAADKDNPEATLDIVFLVNKAQSHQMAVNTRVEVAKTLARVFKDAPFRQNGMVSNTPGDKTVNLYHLPAIDNEEEKSLYNKEYFESCCRAFRNRVLSFPKLATKKKMTEREWLRQACRVWNEIDTAPSMQEYKKILTSMIT